MSVLSDVLGRVDSACVATDCGVAVVHRGHRFPVVVGRYECVPAEHGMNGFWVRNGLTVRDLWGELTWVEVERMAVLARGLVVGGFVDAVARWWDCPWWWVSGVGEWVSGWSGGGGSKRVVEEAVRFPLGGAWLGRRHWVVEGDVCEWLEAFVGLSDRARVVFAVWVRQVEPLMSEQDYRYADEVYPGFVEPKVY